MRKLLLLLMCVSISASQIFAQGKVVKGKVTDEKDGSPLTGVSVVVKGTNFGTTTDKDGAFSLTLPTGAKTLVLSSVNFTSQEVPIGNQSIFSIALVSEEKTISEVVVIGYGTQRKKNT